jgi:hypothetical protein
MNTIFQDLSKYVYLKCYSWNLKELNINIKKDIYVNVIAYFYLSKILSISLRSTFTQGVLYPHFSLCARDFFIAPSALWPFKIPLQSILNYFNRNEAGPFPPRLSTCSFVTQVRKAKTALHCMSTADMFSSSWLSSLSLVNSHTAGWQQLCMLLGRPPFASTSSTKHISRPSVSCTPIWVFLANVFLLQLPLWSFSTYFRVGLCGLSAVLFSA